MRQICLIAILPVLVLAGMRVRAADSPILFDDFGRVTFAKERLRLKRLAAGMRKEFPEHIVYILKYFPKGTPARITKRREREIVDYLTRTVAVQNSQQLGEIRQLANQLLKAEKALLDTLLLQTQENI